MTDDARKPTTTATVLGRQIGLGSLTDGQIMVLTHEGSILQNKNVASERKIKSVDRVYKVLTSIIVDPDDSDFVEDSLATGDIEMRSLIKIFMEAQEKEAAPKNGPVATKARRGRAAQR